MQFTDDIRLWEHQCNYYCTDAWHADVAYVHKQDYEDGRTMEALQSFEKHMPIVVSSWRDVAEAPNPEDYLLYHGPGEDPADKENSQAVLVMFYFVDEKL